MSRAGISGLAFAGIEQYEFSCNFLNILNDNTNNLGLL